MPPVTRSSDEPDLVRRARGGCAESVAELAARHQVALVDYAARLLARRGGRRSDAEDVAQEALVHALGRLDRFDTRWPFSTWLFAIARRRCLNHLRAARRRTARETACAAPVRSGERDDPQAVAISREDSARLWAIASDALSERQFSALWLRTTEDLSVAEIARVLGRPTATVKVLLFRARRRLAVVLRGRDQEPPCVLPLLVPGVLRSIRHG